MKNSTPNTPPSGGYTSLTDIIEAINAALAWLTFLKRTPEQRAARDVRKAARRRDRRLRALDREEVKLRADYAKDKIDTPTYFQLRDDLTERRRAVVSG